MKSRIKRLRVGPLVCPVLLLGTMPQHVAAAVLETNASLAIRVQELIDDAPASFSENDATFPAIGVDLPLTASARVESTDLDGTLVAVGQGFAEFADPVLLAQDNPEELALEVACYSNADNVTYQVHGMATETRTVVFTDARSDLAPPEIQFRLDGTREIESRIFLSGAVLVWTPNLDTDGDGFPNNTLDGLSVDVRLNVSRLVDAADSAPTLLFDTTISTMGAGDTLPAPETTGPIVFELSTVDELVAEGLDDASANALRAVADAGSLTILLVRAQEHAYRYQVRANEPLLLRAELSVEIKNISGGSGIAVAIGRPFSELTDFIEHAIDGAMPIPVQQSINAALAGRDVGFVPSGTGGRGALCGALGIEVVPFALALGLCPRRRRRRAGGARYPRADSL